MALPLNNIDDAIELLSLVEQLTGSAHDRGLSGELPVRGITLTVQRARELLVSARNGFPAAARPAKPTPRPTVAETPRKVNEGHIRELAPSSPQGTFQRIVLPREEPNDPLEH